jgi:hypothetical protein
MAQRFAGIAILIVGGTQVNLRGNFTVSPSIVERTMIAGQDRVHGYQELPRVPYIEGDISCTPDINLKDLEAEVNITVIAQLANGKAYSLQEACCKAALEENTRDGQVRVRWEGVNCLEMNIVGPG